MTTLRFLLVPVFVIVFYNVSPTAGLVVYLVASITDWLDGFIARRYNLITKWGKLMDPLADKVMLITALVVLVNSGMLPLYILVFVALKEIVQVLAAAFVLRRKDIVVPANWTGKIATVLFTVGVALSFFSGRVKTVGYIVVLAAIALSVLAFVRYAIIVIPQYFDKQGRAKRPEEEE